MDRQPVTHANAWPRFCFAVETGEMELAVGEAAAARVSRPEKVTAILSAMLAEIDDSPATPALVRTLSTGTREWLLQQAAASCRPGADWFDVTCRDCDAVHDIAFDVADLPRSDPAQGFPVVTVETPNGPLSFEVPNGFHEEALAKANVADRAARRFMLGRAALFEDADEVVTGLDRITVSRIEAAIDAAAPDVADRAQSTCPTCDAEHETPFDPLAYAFPPEGRLLRDVHVLSTAHHWSEAAVLAMPTRRRKAYVSMIAEAGARR